MILNTIRLIADALGSPIIGVNAKLATMDFAEDDAPANIALVADETRNDTVALRQAPDTTPALLVTADDSVDVSSNLLNSRAQDATVSVVVHYIGSHVLTGTGRTDYYHTMRAVRSTIGDLFDPANEAARTRNGILAMDYETMTLVEPGTFKETGTITGGLRVTVRVRDTLS